MTAARANRDRSVILFRERFLGGGVLTEEQAWAFLAAPENSGVPVYPDPARFLPYDLRDESEPHPRMRVDARAVSCLPCIAPNGEPAWVEYREGTLLSRLHPLVSRLARDCAWSPPDATMFVLSGQPPYIHPFRVQRALTPNRPITIKVMPWVPANLVAEEIRAAQRALGLVKGRMRLHAYEVLRIVEERAYIDEIEAVDMDTLRLWNETYAGADQGTRRKPYDETPRGLQRFRQDLKRERADVVLDPEWPLPPGMNHNDFNTIAAP
jgi:hypothetical protein